MDKCSSWMKKYVDDCDKIIYGFEQTINDNTYLRVTMNRMIKEIPDKIDNHCKHNYFGYKETTYEKKPKNFSQVCDRLYEVITSAPPYYGSRNPFTGLPMIDLFSKLIASNQGLLFFGNIIVNQHLKVILDLWSEFLSRPESRYILTRDTWLGMDSISEFAIDKKDQYYGFKSWNDFFIRKFADMDKSRPLDKDAYIVSPCDAIINSFKRKIRYKTDFMRVKGDIYSLKDILKNVDKSLIKKFVGGTIVQGYLSAETYHRYHSPVEGVLVDAFVIDGSYFLVNNFYKSNLNRFCGQNQVKNSQEFLANVQTRGVFIFKTDEIGYVVFIAIGMTEVSSCIIYDKLIGKRIHRGEEIGHFQYGGSSYLMIFERKHQDKLEFTFNTSKMTKIRSSMALLKSG